MAWQFSCLKTKNFDQEKTKGKGIYPYMPYFTGIPSRVIFRSTPRFERSQDDKAIANHMARMCSAWITHALSYVAFAK